MNERKSGRKKIIIPLIIAVVLIIGIVSVILISLCTGDKEGTSAKLEGKNKSESTEQGNLSLIGNVNSLQIKGYEYYGSGKQINDTNDIILKSYIPRYAEIGDENISSFNIVDYDGDCLYYYYYTFVVTSIEYGMPNFDEDSIKLHLAKTDIATMENQEVVIDDYCYSIKYGVDGFSVVAEKGDTQVISYYDKQLKLTDERVQYGASSVVCTGAGKCYYYAKDGRLYMADAAGNETEIVVDANVLVDYVNGIVSCYDTDYIGLTCTGADFYNYDIIVDAANGHVMYVQDTDTTMVYFEDNTCKVSLLNEEFFPIQWVISNEEKSFDYTLTGDIADTTSYTLGNGDNIFSYMEDGSTVLQLYSGKTGELIGTTKVPMRQQAADEYSEGGIYYYLAEAVWLNESELLVQLMDFDENVYFCVWNLKNAKDYESIFQVSEHVGNTVNEIELPDGADIKMYAPSELSEDLLALREIADEIEERFGVEILIGQECGDILGGYAVTPLTEYEAIDEALGMLERELEKYPEGFFEQMHDEDTTESVFYIAGSLQGIDDANLSMAGGFRLEEAGRDIIVMNCETPYSSDNTIHHEISHSIDSYLLEKSEKDGVEYLSEDSWNELNPADDCYTYSYGEQGKEQYMANTYFESCGDGDLSKVYFIDDYSMTYPTEDRARIFEYAMVESDWVEFSQMPNLANKLEYYCNAIREGFDTTGWDEVMWWEQCIKESN